MKGARSHFKEAHSSSKGIEYNKESLSSDKLRQSLSNIVEENIILKNTIKQLKEELNKRGKMITRMTLQIGNEDRLREIQRMKRKVLYINYIRFIL